MRYLGIDYGLKRAGLALCDPTETFVSPLCQLPVDANRPNMLIKPLQQLIDDHQVQAVVVGLPLHMDGSEGPQVQITRRFVDQLKNALNVPVLVQDERLSSAAADEKLDQVEFTKKQRKKRRDMLAACEILQDFLDTKTLHQ